MSSQPLMVNCRVFKGETFHRIRFNPRLLVRALVFAFWLWMISAASLSLAYGQSFGLSIPLGLNRPAVDPGGSALATIDLTTTGGFSSLVSLSCAVTSGPVTTSPPVCTVSPATQVPPADGPSLTITTTDTTAVGLYNFIVTGTSGSITQTATLNLTVQPLSQDYTLSVSPTTATPNPVAAGSAATATVTISPIGSYSGHQITLSCLSVSPVVTLAPVCSFQPTSGSGPGPVQVTSGIPATATLTITTSGPTPVTKLGSRGIFYALWLVLPGLALITLGAKGIRRKTAMGALCLTLVAGGLIFMPACGSSGTSIGTVTPSKTYVFTLTGADENGAAPSNTTTNQATVSVIVN
ncbi:MAG: hypothetical protein JWQ87_553 [Candidatus Sulfotelmatobacter sp.]|nr:hypothetical protein [Candidatus Sulfotelmatobacter sp.]